MENITKLYPNGVVANHRVDFTLESGEIHSLIGENGAGKSTLMKVLFGLEHPDEGEIYLRGEKTKITSPSDAISKGIGMVHQHFKLVSSLTVAENIVLGIEPEKGLFFNKAEAIKITKELSEKYDLHVNPIAVIDDIPVGEKQKVEILKALYRGAKILILDEPTAVLTPQETKELFTQLINLKNSGHTIVFISHKLKELKAICDRLTVMRNGESKGVYKTSDVTQEEISRIMVGRDVILHVEKEKCKPGKSYLQVKDIISINEENKKTVNGVSVSVRKGEILGVAGVEGNGQTELVEIITGLRKAHGGIVEVNGQNIEGLSIRQIRDLGMAYIPQDRMVYGISKDASIQENLISNDYSNNRLHGKLLFKTKRIINLAKTLIQDFKVKCKSEKVKVGMLSGGNIQKVVVARECHLNPNLLVAEQPTRGVDVGAIEFIHKKIIEMRNNDCAVMLLSADLNEILELSDAVIVMHDGKIVAYFEDASQLTEEELGFYMLGVKKQDSEEIGRAYYA